MNKKLNVFTIILFIVNFFLLTFLVISKYVISDKMIKFLNNYDLNYISYVLYDENKIKKVLIDNKKIDKFLISATLSNNIISSEIDKSFDDQILINDTDNSLYKLINLNVAGYNAYLAVIYDASKVKLITSSSFNTGNSQEQVIRMCDRLNGSVCINGGGFVDYGSGSDTPIGYIIKDGKIMWSDSYDNSLVGNLIGFDYDNKLTLVSVSGNDAVKMGIRDALQFGPYLIVDGKDIDMSNDYTGGYAGASRVAIGQREDGIVLFLVTDGMHGRGPSLADVQKVLKQYGAYNAANLDGGASAQMVMSGRMINTPKNIYGETIYNGRRVVSGFGVFE